MPVRPDQIKTRFTISLPDLTDKLILTAIMNSSGANKSTAIRIALRFWAKAKGIEMEPTQPTIG